MPDLRVLPKQYDFITATEPEVMYSGAVGAGKTRALCIKAAARAARKGAREILCRKTLSALKGTTLKTLLEGDGDLPPVLPPGSYTHNKADKEIRLQGGGEIIYFALVNDGAEGVQQRAGSYNGTGVNIDEATELDEGDYRMLLSRARIKVAGVVNQVNLSCNPGTPSHFLAKRFAPPGSGVPAPMTGCRCISTRTHENFFLPKSYIENLDRDTGSLWYRRFVEGLWCGAEGLVYDRFDRQIHVRERPQSELRSFYVGVDDGYTNPSVALLVGTDGDGRIHVVSERYRPGLLPDARIAQIAELCQGRNVEAVVIDPSAADIIALARERGLPAIPADNDVRTGINGVSGRFAVAGDGKPRITFAPTCTDTIRELETYQWKPGKDEPVKAHDHAMDALRYVIKLIDGVGTPAVAWSGPQANQSVGLQSPWGDVGWESAGVGDGGF